LRQFPIAARSCDGVPWKAAVSFHRLDSFSAEAFNSTYSSSISNASQVRGLTEGTDSSVRSGQFSNLVEQATPAQPRLMSMVMQSLAASMDRSNPITANSNAASSSQPPMQAMSSFMNKLMKALQNQTTAALPATEVTNSATETETLSANHPGLQTLNSSSQIGTALQNLATQLSGTASSHNTTVTALQQSYSNLIDSLGGNPENASLNQFLNNFEQQLQTMGPTGNLVNVTA
jgi:hypothetical protein